MIQRSHQRARPVTGQGLLEALTQAACLLTPIQNKSGLEYWVQPKREVKLVRSNSLSQLSN